MLKEQYHQTLTNQVELLRQERQKRNQFESEFIKTYGFDLAKSAIACKGLDNSGIPDHVNFNGQLVHIDIVRTAFVESFASGLNNQPLELRGRWLNGFVTALEKLTPLKSRI